MEENSNRDILRGNINSLILKSLEDGDKYGYEIGKYIESMVGGDYKLKEPTLYSSLKRLESRKLIESYWSDEDSHGGRRKYFHLTDFGRQISASNISDWRQSKTILDKGMSDDKEQKDASAPRTERTNRLNAASAGQASNESSSDRLSFSAQNRISRFNLADNEEINPEYRTILSKLLKNVKNELDSTLKNYDEESSEAATAKTDEANFFFAEKAEEEPDYNGFQEKNNIFAEGNLIKPAADDIQAQKSRPLFVDEELAVATKSDESEGSFSLLPSSSPIGSFAAVQRAMASQGFSLKSYSTKNTSPKQFLLINRINMLSAILLFLVAALQTAAIYYFWEPVINIGLKYYVYILAVVLIIPVISSLVYLFNPHKRTKKKYNMFYSIVSSMMFFIVCCLGILSIALLLNIDVNNTYEMIIKLYIPTIYASNFIFYTVIWAILYKTNSCRY